MADTVNTELIRGHVDTIILRILALGDSYPYDILKQISEKTQGRYQLKQATLYSCMKRLEKNGLITSYWGDESDGGRRKYYSLTDKGLELLERDQAEWEYSRTIINNLLSDREFDLANDEAPFDASSLRPLTRRTRAMGEKEDPAEVEDDDEILVNTPYMVHRDTEREENNPPVSLFDYADRQEEEALDRKNEENVTNESAAAQENPVQTEQPTAAMQDKPRELTIDEVRQRDEASRQLQIGEFAQHEIWDPTLDQPAPTERPADESTYAPRDINDTYRIKLDNLYANEEEEVEQSEHEVSATTTTPQELNLIQFNDLKNTMLQQGYRLRLYNRPSELSRKYLKYIYGNKLLKDSYLALFIPLLAIYIVTLCLNTYTLITNILLGVSITLVPIIPLLIFTRNPDKRTRDEYVVGHDIVIRTVIALLAMIVTFIILMFGFSINITETPLKYIIAWLLCLTIPIYSVIRYLLLKRQTYYLDK